MPDKFMERQEYLDKMRKISAQQRIHPTRTFYPGQTYQPEVYQCANLPSDPTNSVFLAAHLRPCPIEPEASLRMKASQV